MRSYTITLTSVQPTTPSSIIDHYFFYDSRFGLNFTYPNSADGSLFNTTTGTFVYPVTADSENIYPWGYSIQNNQHTLTVGPLKGPYTVTFDTASLDVSQSAIIKINYDFGDGTSTTVNRQLGDTLTQIDPNNVSIGHDYYPKDDTVTVYNSVVTVTNGNLIEDVFNIAISSVPASIYDFDDVYLINNTQQIATAEMQNILEIAQPNYLAVTRVLSAAEAAYYPTVAPFNPITSLSGYENNLILWLDASDALTLSRDNKENVITWYDKSLYNNNFFSDSTTTSPTFKYPRQSRSLRKCVSFTIGKYLYALSDLWTGNYSFDSIIDNKGYSVFAVMRINKSGGTLFAYDLNRDEQLNPSTGDSGDGVNYVPNLNISLGSPNAITVEQGDTSFYFGTSANDPNGVYQPTTISNISYNLSAYSLYSITLSGDENAQLYITADTAIARRRYQNYQYNLSSFLSGGFNSSTVLYPPTGQNIPAGTYDKKLVYALLGTSDAYFNSYLRDTEISEFMIFNKPLDPVATVSVLNYLANKWNLTLRTD